MNQAEIETQSFQRDCQAVRENPRCSIRKSSALEFVREVSSCKMQMKAAQCDSFFKKYPSLASHQNSCAIGDVCAGRSHLAMREGCRQVGIELAESINGDCKKGYTQGICIAGNLIRSSFDSMLPYLKGPLFGGRSIVADTYRGTKKAIEFTQHFSCVDTLMQNKLACYIAVGSGAAILSRGAAQLRFATIAREIEGLDAASSVRTANIAQKAVKPPSASKILAEVEKPRRDLLFEDSTKPNQPIIAVNEMSLRKRVIRKIKTFNSSRTHDGNSIEKFYTSPDSLFAKDSLPRFTSRGISSEEGVIKPGSNTQLNAIVAEVEANGGQVRSLSNVALDMSRTPWRNSYFRTSDDGVPIIALEKGESISTAVHELEHFRDFVRVRDNFIREGVGPEQARMKAKKFMENRNPEILRQTEQHAVRAELDSTQSTLLSDHLVERVVYPEKAAISRAISRAEVLGNPLSPKQTVQINGFMDDAIQKALRTREIRREFLSEYLLDPTLSRAQRTAAQRQLQTSSDITTLSREMELDPHPALLNLFRQRLPKSIGP